MTGELQLADFLRMCAKIADGLLDDLNEPSLQLVEAELNTALGHVHRHLLGKITPMPRKAQKITWLHSARCFADHHGMDAQERIAAESRALGLNRNTEEVVVTPTDTEAIVKGRLPIETELQLAGGTPAPLQR